jgi:RimJ/RimL family protein N-acetyltransferase
LLIRAAKTSQTAGTLGAILPKAFVKNLLTKKIISYKIKREHKFMSIIKTHNITLYGKTENYNVRLFPMNDEHLKILQKWNNDPEVLYWCEGDDDLAKGYTEEDIHQIYGSVSQNAFCFIINANDTRIGECWLQKMNLQYIKNMYPKNTDIRRIDMVIGEKDYWNKGIGTEIIRILIDFAFDKENVDVLHCMCNDYNIRSQRVWGKNNFSLILKEELPQPQKGKYCYHYRLLKSEYNSVI